MCIIVYKKKNMPNERLIIMNILALNIKHNVFMSSHNSYLFKLKFSEDQVQTTM